jgi:hypothetical protein
MKGIDSVSPPLLESKLLVQKKLQINKNCFLIRPQSEMSTQPAKNKICL